MNNTFDISFACFCIISGLTAEMLNVLFTLKLITEYQNNYVMSAENKIIDVLDKYQPVYAQMP